VSHIFDTGDFRVAAMGPTPKVDQGSPILVDRTATTLEPVV
jgi:hypothetical protein